MSCSPFYMTVQCQCPASLSSVLTNLLYCPASRLIYLIIFAFAFSLMLCYFQSKWLLSRIFLIGFYDLDINLSFSYINVLILIIVCISPPARQLTFIYISQYIIFREPLEIKTILVSKLYYQYFIFIKYFYFIASLLNI